MAMTIMNNPSAMLTLGELNKNVSKLGKQLKKVASGERITGAGDDSSGYAISEKMRVRIRALGQADRNTQTGVSLIRTAEGAIQSQIDILKSIKDKVLNAQNDTNTDIDRATIQKEIDQGYQQMEDIAWETNYNGILLLCGGDVVEHTHTNWSEEEKPEFGIYDNSTMGISPFVTKTILEDKSGNATARSRIWTGMNQQPVDPNSDILGSVDSRYDVAAPYSSGIASIQPTIGTVGNSLPMQHGVSWQAATNKITIAYNDSVDSVDDVLASLKNRSFDVTLNGETKKFVFADDLQSTQRFSYTYDYQYTDTSGNPQTVTGKNGSVDVSVTPAATYVDGVTSVSLRGIKSRAGTAADAANWALGQLADKIAAAFGTYDVDGATGSASQSKIYGDKIADGVLTLASGEYDFTVSAGTETPVTYTDSALNAKVQAAIDADKLTAATNDLGSTPHIGGPTVTRAVPDTDPPIIASASGSAGTATAGDAHIAEKSAYVDIKLEDLINGTTDIEEMINKFLFKARDNELDTADADSSDTNVFDTGNNFVVDKSFTVTAYNGSSITYEFIDTNRPDLDADGNPVGTTAGKNYLYDEQKIPGSVLCDLNDFRNLYYSTGNLRTALGQFLYDSLSYESYGRNTVYTRQLMDDSSHVIGAGAATKIRLYSYEPYEGTEASSAPISATPTYMSDGLHNHYSTGRYSGQGAKGSDGVNDSLVTDESYLCSYDFDLKAWWAANIGDTAAAGDEATAEAVGNRLNQRGFRFYCPSDNTASSQKEWVNIYFTDHSIEDDLKMERPTAGNSPLSTGDKIDTIVVDVRDIKNYKDLTRAIYEQTNLLSWASEPSPQGATPGAASENAGQVGFAGNPVMVSRAHTDYFSHFHFAMDEDKGILTIFDTDRYAHGNDMYVSDGVYDNVRLEVREVKEKRLIIHDTDHASQAVAVHIPRTTLDYVFGYNPSKASASDYTVLRKEMREKMLGMSKDSVGILDRGLDYLTSANCLLGAQINRLDYSHANLVTSVENTVASESTLRDADMAREMMEYTKANVLMQSSQSMLAQANQNSSSVLSLLQ